MLPHYYSLNEYLHNTFGKKVYKIALNGGMSCPNRDGLIDTRGCIFCSAGGSGDFAGDTIHFNTNPSHWGNIDINNQINAGMKLLSSKYHGRSYIAYFQAFTNTYAPIAYLRKIFTDAIMNPNIICLSIATRPDCISEEIVDLLYELSQIKPIWVELGLQTIHKQTSDYIRRGYELDVFENAIALLRTSSNGNSPRINIIVHMIIGLPGESRTDMLETATYLSHCDIDGIKLQLLHVLKDTDLAIHYANHTFSVLSLEEYTEILSTIIELLPPRIVIHRLTGDGPKNLLVAPIWSSNKKHVLNTINAYFKQHAIIQGKQFI